MECPLDVPLDLSVMPAGAGFAVLRTSPFTPSWPSIVPVSWFRSAAETGAEIAVTVPAGSILKLCSPDLPAAPSVQFGFVGQHL